MVVPGIYRTKFNQYDSIVRPLLAWLDAQGVTIQLGTTVTDLAFAAGSEVTVQALHWTRNGATEQIALGPDEFVFVTDGSMTADSTLGSTTTPPTLHTTRSADAWKLWRTLAATSCRRS
ncbi:oleate hydratase [Amycolatopsis sp. NPDC051373]|uniref:oleate hydratase n=1 Tax=Amycolatopsis sp. NPDC051373 TaxID=3155801 RepID=UPI00344E78BF